VAFIKSENLVKEYKINVKKKGLLGAINSLLIPEYKIKKAVDNISFSIEKGEMVGFIGPNGAGKSTTVKMLTGILVPSSGEISIGGLSPYKNRKAVASKIGVVFGQRTQLWWDLPVIDTFDLLKFIYKIPDKEYKKNLDMFSELLEIHKFMNQPVRQLSLGQRMRADIAASMLHNPEMVFFDEPTIGLDVVAKERIREFIKYINAEKGTTMLFTTHDMQDIEKTCNRMIIIDNGTIIYDGSIHEIKHRFGNYRIVEVEFQKEYKNLSFAGVKLINSDGNRKKFKVDQTLMQVTNLINELTQKYEVQDITIQEPEIEQIIRDIYQGGICLDKNVC